MSRIAPDIPELQDVPYAARSLVYTQAFGQAIRSRVTWVMGGIVFGAGVGIGANQGSALFGQFGAVVGTLLGAVAGVWSFFKLVLPWRARRIVPSVIASTAPGTHERVGQADASVARMVDAVSAREPAHPGEPDVRRRSDGET